MDEFHVSLPGDDEPVAVNTPSDAAKPTINITNDVVDAVINSDEAILRVLKRPDLTQKLARFGLFELFKQKLMLSEPVPERAVAKQGDRYCYQIHVSQRGQGLAAVSLLLHYKKFTAEEINGMVSEATEITNTARIVTRRSQMASARTPVPDARKTNDTLFPSDVEFFEAVMMDKFEFVKLATIDAKGSIEPTVKI